MIDLKEERIQKNNFDDSVYKISETDIFRIDLFAENIKQFNNAVDSQNPSYVMLSVETLIKQMIDFNNSTDNPDSDPELLPNFDCSKFYLNCIKCLNEGNNELISKIIYMLGLLADLSTQIADTLVESYTLQSILQYILNKPFDHQLLLSFFYFIEKTSLTSVDARDLMYQSGILNFFSNALQSKIDVKVVLCELKCIRSFFTFETFIDINDSPQLDLLFRTLNQCIVNIITNNFGIKIDDFDKWDICLLIMNIFNIYIGVLHYSKLDIKENCSRFLSSSIPLSLINLLTLYLPIITDYEFICLILCNINQLFINGRQELVLSFASKLNILLFTQLCELKNNSITEKSLLIIENLLKLQPNYINILIEINFFSKLFQIIEDSSFRVQVNIINIILYIMNNATSIEIQRIFTNEIIINYIIELIDVPEIEDPQLIPSALSKMKVLLQPTDSMYIEIENALQQIYFKCLE